MAPFISHFFGSKIAMRAFSNVRTYCGQAAGCYVQVEATNANKANKAFQTGKWNTVCQDQSLL